MNLPFIVSYWCIFACFFQTTVHTCVRFGYAFIKMYSFTNFIIFVTAPYLFTNTILLEHAYRYQRTMHCPLLAVFAWYPVLFIFR